MSINLNITFTNNDNYIEQLSLTSEKQKLINCSKYFTSLFSNSFNESEQTEINIDLTLLKYFYDAKYINLLFDVEMDHNYDYTPCNSSRMLKVHLDTNLDSELKSIHIIKIHLGLKNINVNELYILQSLADFFEFNKSKEIINMCFINYEKLMKRICVNGTNSFSDDEDEEETVPLKSKKSTKESNVIVCEEEEELEEEAEEKYVSSKSKQITEKTVKCKCKCDCECDCENECDCECIAGCIRECVCKKVNSKVIDTQKPIESHQSYNTQPGIVEFYKLYFDKIININSLNLQAELDNYRTNYILNDFLENIYYVYLGYANAGLRNKFNKIMSYISKKIQSNKHTHNVNVYVNNDDAILNGISLTIDNLKQIPLEDCYNLSQIDKKLITLEHNIFKLYDFYDILNYETSNWDTFHINDVEHKYEIGKKCIKSKDDVLKDFETKTKGIFKGMCWNNVILAGGFTFGLVNNLHNSLISSTDIDLFIYNDVDDIDENNGTSTVQNILKHFSQFNPYYITRGKVITLIIPDFEYDIQIIPTSKKSPREIIESFDFSYVKMYYDGNDIYTTLDGLIGLKNAITIYKPQEENNKITTIRLYKAIVKGLKIRYNGDIKNKYIDNKNIDFDGLHNNDEVKLALNKAHIVKKLMNHVSGYELIPIIQTYYKSKNVTTKLNSNGYPIYDNDSHNEYVDSSKDEYGLFSDKYTLKNKIDVTNIMDLVVKRSFSMMNWFSFKLNNGEEMDALSLEIDYCKFKIYKSAESTPHKISLILDLNDETCIKLDKLRNQLTSICTNPKNKILRNGMHIYANENDDDDDEYNYHSHTKAKKDNKYGNKVGQLKVHLSDNKTEQSIKLNETINKLNPAKDQIKVMCTGTFWATKDKQQGGIKFHIDTLKYRRPYCVI